MLATRIAAAYEANGLRGVWFGGLAVTFYRRLWLFSLELDRYPGAGEQPEGLEVGELGEAMVDQYREMRPDTPAAEVMRRLRSDQLCVYVRREGRIVSARWIDLARVEVAYLGLAFELAPGSAHLYDVYTAPEARRARIGRATFPRYVAMLADRGVKRLLVTSLPENRAGVGLTTAAGYRRVGSIGALRLGPVRVPVRRIAEGRLGPATRFRS